MDEDIKRAIFYQRPCSFLALNIDNSRTFCDMHGELSFEQALRKVAGLLKEYEGQFGKAARIGWDEFALLLPEKNKREAMDLAEDIRRRVESVIFADSQKMPMTVSIGVSENPIDGSTKDDLFKKAQDALARAKEKGKNRVMA
jgi:diguanylate cyclase (GGDEF)-like protein